MMKHTKKVTALQKGLSLIESAMVLAISAAVVSGVLYYYNQAQENRKLEEGIKQIQSIAASVNKLYTNSTIDIKNTHTDDDTNKIVEAISVISGVPTKIQNTTKVFISPTGQWIQFWTNKDMERAYNLEIQTISLSSCMSYATLNLGTIMAKKTSILVDSKEINDSDSSSSNSLYLSPSQASSICELAYKETQGMSRNIKVRYTLRY